MRYRLMDRKDKFSWDITEVVVLYNILNSTFTSLSFFLEFYLANLTFISVYEPQNLKKDIKKYFKIIINFF